MEHYSEWPQDPPCTPSHLCIWDCNSIFFLHILESKAYLWFESESFQETFQSPTRLASSLEYMVISIIFCLLQSIKIDSDSLQDNQIMKLYKFSLLRLIYLYFPILCDWSLGHSPGETQVLFVQPKLSVP